MEDEEMVVVAGTVMAMVMTNGIPMVFLQDSIYSMTLMSVFHFYIPKYSPRLCRLTWRDVLCWSRHAVSATRPRRICKVEQPPSRCRCR